MRRVLPRRNLSLAAQFLIMNLIILLAGALIVGSWVGQQIEFGVLTRTAGIAALYVESIVEPFLAPLAEQPSLDDAGIVALDRLLTDTPLGERVVAFRIWSPDGVVVYSPKRELIGRAFPPEGGLVRALEGDVAAEMSDLASAENELEVGEFSRLLEVYAPVRVRGGTRIIAIAEFYQLPTELEQEIAVARSRSWAIVAAVAAVSYVLLSGIVKRGSDTIGRQQAALRLQVAELSRLLEQNALLSGRVALAARRATTLNEQVFRRIGSDLHDGPGQALALALLRLDALGDQQATLNGGAPNGDFATVHAAVHDAMADLRAIAAGLRLPDLGVRTLGEVARRATRDHERRSGTAVLLRIEDNVPDEAPLAVKIALVRSLQEALSNATRHAGGINVSATLSLESGRLCLSVADGGPGFILERAETEATGHLGLAGMRERAEILGGSFCVTTAPGHGTVVRLSWPLTERGMS